MWLVLPDFTLKSIDDKSSGSQVSPGVEDPLFNVVWHSRGLNSIFVLCACVKLQPQTDGGALWSTRVGSGNTGIRVTAQLHPLLQAFIRSDDGVALNELGKKISMWPLVVATSILVTLA